MKDGFNKDGADTPEMANNEIYSKVVRAGKRTYFFDVKATRRNDYYITITESKRQSNDMGGFSYEKHKIFLYGEDFDKFMVELNDVINFVNNKMDSVNDLENEMIEEVDLQTSFNDV